MSEESSNFVLTHEIRVFLFVEENESSHPIHVSLFGAIGIMPGAKGVRELVEELFCHGL